MTEYMTGLRDCDLFLLEYLPMDDIMKLILVNKPINRSIIATHIYSEINQLIKISVNEIMINCYKKGLLKILKKYHKFGKNVIISDGIDQASHNGTSLFSNG